MISSAYDIEDTKTSITLRPLSGFHDIQIIYEWAKYENSNRTWQAGKSLEVFKEVYQALAESSFAGSYIAEDKNRTPILQVEVCNAILDYSSFYYKALRGDLCLNLLLSPHCQKHRHTTMRALIASLEYFFSIYNAKRIVAPFYKPNEELAQLLLKAGFIQGKRPEGQKLCKIYTITRERFGGGG